jgi:hypothetical protein
MCDLPNRVTTSLTSMGNSADSLAVDPRAILAHTRAGAPFLHDPHDGQGIDRHATPVRTAVPMLLVLMLGALSLAGEPPRAPAASTPSIEGTDQLTSRQTPDAAMLRPPDVMGLKTYTKSHSTCNVVRKDATGTCFSSSTVSTSTLTATEYRETRLFSVRDDQIGGQDIVDNLSSETRNTPVTAEEGRIQLKDPFGPRVLVFEGNTMTAPAADNANVMDIWAKVE